MVNYVFYADVFFLTNFYLDFLAVCAVSEILQKKKKMLRCLAGCAFSSLLGCILLLHLENYDLYLFCMHFIVNPGMTFICFFPAKRGIYGKAFCLMYLILLLLGGSVEWMYQTVAGGRCYELCVLLSGIPAAVFLYILRQKRKDVHCFYQARIIQGEHYVCQRALYDTGNRLEDPYVREPVHIISREIFQRLGGEDAYPMRLIPFTSVGCENGMLEAFTAETMVIDTADGTIEIPHPVLAVAGEELFLGRNYQMILNSSLGEKIERREEKTCT